MRDYAARNGPRPPRSGPVVVALGTELFKDVGAVRGECGFDDVVLFCDLLASVPELGGGVVGVRFLVDEGGDGLAEGVRGDPTLLPQTVDSVVAVLAILKAGAVYLPLDQH